jgi:hypothetical protein
MNWLIAVQTITVFTRLSALNFQSFRCGAHSGAALNRVNTILVAILMNEQFN